jgi:hypothetical protein
VVAGVGWYVSHLIACANRRSGKHPQKRDVYGRLNKNLSEIIDICELKEISIALNTGSKLLQYGKKKDATKPSFGAIGFQFGIPNDKISQTLMFMNESILIAEEKTKASLLNLKEKLEAEQNKLHVNGMPQHLYELIKSGRKDKGGKWEIYPDESTLNNFFREHAERMLPIAKSAKDLRSLLGDELD